MNWTVNAVSGKTLLLERCGTLNNDRKTLRQAEKILPATMWSTSNRLIDATISFYGTYVQINEQVTLQSQDPKMYGVYKSSLIDLKAEVVIN